MKLQKINLTFVELVELRKQYVDIPLTPEEKDALLKKMAWKTSFNEGNSFTVITGRFDATYKKLTNKIIQCVRFKADSMGNHGNAETVYYEIVGGK